MQHKTTSRSMEQAVRRYLAAGESLDKAQHSGSHMPIDTDIHWQWRNPLNVIPALLLIVIALAIVGSIAMFA